MASVLTVEQILALAPDSSAAKAGQGLANTQKWLTLACDAQAAWGECAGSAATPYQTQIDLTGPAFKCSCPSRKFPCKHSLGLYLLLTTKPGAFQQTAPPEWVAQWLASRARREEKKTEASAEPRETTPDPQAQARRAAQREKKVERGLEELDRWLCDLARQGLALVQTQPRSFWESMAAHMVDAQASGVARLLRRMATIPSSGEGWQERLLSKLGLLYLLIERYQRIDSLSEEAKADLQALIGWTQNQSELLAGEGIADQWLVLGQRVQREDRLRVQRNWLCGRNSGRSALLLQYAPGKDAFGALVVPGTLLEAELVFYPGAYPLRALIKSQQPAVPVSTFDGFAAIPEAYKAYAGALVKYPWLEQFPMPCQQVTPLLRDEQWFLRDAGGNQIPLAADFAFGWEMLAFSGGRPIAVFGEWTGEALFPLAMASEERFVALTAIEE